MTQPHVLESVEIDGFRAFRVLRIERLGHVNLITGKNNVGKSSLLEALWVYAHRGSPTRILRLMEGRDEIQYVSSYTSSSGDADGGDQQLMNIKHLFYGRSDIQERPASIRIGPINRPADLLSITAGWLSPTYREELGDEQQPLFPMDQYRLENRVLALVVQLGNQDPSFYPIAQYIERRRLLRERSSFSAIPCVLIPANALESDQLASLWDGIALTDLEQDVLHALRIISPGVERITLVGEQPGRRARVPIVRAPHFNIPVPLRSMGEGMNRLFGIALALVNAQDGMLLIDEIDSGLHYSVQPDLWRMVFQVAHRLNIQVFATTHSWDCVTAFQESIQNGSEDGGLLISLRDRKGEPGRVVAVLFDEEELAIVTREQIEVR